MYDFADRWLAIGGYHTKKFIGKNCQRAAHLWPLQSNRFWGLGNLLSVCIQEFVETTAKWASVSSEALRQRIMAMLVWFWCFSVVIGLLHSHFAYASLTVEWVGCCWSANLSRDLQLLSVVRSEAFVCIRACLLETITSLIWGWQIKTVIYSRWALPLIS